MLAISNNSWLSYNDLKIENLATSAIWNLTGLCFNNFNDLECPIMRQRVKFQHNQVKHMKEDCCSVVGNL